MFKTILSFYLICLIHVDAAELNIIYTNNIEGSVTPCNCAIDPGGGVERRLNWYKQNAINPNDIIYIDSGDTLFQSLNYAKEELKTITLGSSIIADSLLKMNIDAFTPGETDFALGAEYFNKVTKKIPVLISNIKSDKYKTVIKVERAGYKISIFGVVSPSLIGSSLKVTDLIKDLSAQVQKNKKDSDILILLAHTTMDELKNIIKKIPDIDLVISAHIDEELREPLQINNTIVVRLLKNGDSIGVLKYNQKSKIAKKLNIDKNNTFIAEVEQLNLITQFPSSDKQRLKMIQDKKNKIETLIINKPEDFNTYLNNIVFLGTKYVSTDTKNNKAVLDSINEYKKLQNSVEKVIQDDDF